MGRFITDLDISLGSNSDEIWALDAPLVFMSDIYGMVIAPRGFQSDLASVPRVPFVYSLWGAKAHREAIIHDYLYRIDSKPRVSFWIANKIFLEAMVAREKPLYVRQPMYWGVCIGGYWSYHKRAVDAVLLPTPMSGAN